MPTTVMSTPGKESPKQPNYPTPAAPEAAEEVDAPAPPPVVELTKDLAPTTVAPTTVAPTVPAECSNDSLPTDKPTNGCEPSFVYMIPKNETTLKEGIHLTFLFFYEVDTLYSPFTSHKWNPKEGQNMALTPISEISWISKDFRECFFDSELPLSYPLLCRV